ncbi:unnamed protein product, partial [Mesorhabditis spiculigera]
MAFVPDLMTLPSEVMRVVMQYLDMHSLCALSQSSQRLRQQVTEWPGKYWSTIRFAREGLEIWHGFSVLKSTYEAAPLYLTNAKIEMMEFEPDATLPDVPGLTANRLVIIGDVSGSRICQLLESVKPSALVLEQRLATFDHVESFVDRCNEQLRTLHLDELCPQLISCTRSLHVPTIDVSHVSDALDFQQLCNFVRRILEEWQCGVRDIVDIYIRVDDMIFPEARMFGDAFELVEDAEYCYRAVICRADGATLQIGVSHSRISLSEAICDNATINRTSETVDSSYLDDLVSIVEDSLSDYEVYDDIY